MTSLFHLLRGFLSGDGVLLLPELELVLFAIGILLIDRWLAESEKHWNAVLALAGAAFSGFTLYVQLGKMHAVRAANPDLPGLLGLHQSLLVDPFFLFFAGLLLAATVLTILLSADFLERQAAARGSYYALLLLACAGMMLVASGVNVIVIFAGLQAMAFSCYRLLGFVSSTADPKGRPAFAALWACSSVLLLLGFLLLYGEFQTTNLGRMGAMLDLRLDKGVPFAGLTTWHAVLALAGVAAGTFFLIEASPLHFCSPAIYESAPTPIAGFFSAVIKIAGFALLLRLFAFLFLFGQQRWIHLWGGAAILSLLWGNIAALRERNVLRLLAYASVAHAGFVLLGLVAANESGFNGLAYYLGAYVFATAGLFGVLAVVRQSGASVSAFADLRGLYRRNPAAALLLLLFAVSLAGIPATSGFVAKYQIVKGLLSAAHPHPELAVFAVANALLSVFYYARLAASAFQKTPVETTTADLVAPPVTPAITIGSAQTIALTIAAFVSLAAGLYPAPFLRIANYVFGQ
jgi:NADH-quinone oxidoreductase subunit N